MSQPAALSEALSRVPFYGADAVTAPITGGFRNILYRVQCGGAVTALRLGKPAPRNHGDEFHNLRVAHGLGLAPPILFADEADGMLVTPFVDGVLDPWQPPALDTVDRLGKVYARLHGGPPFRGEVRPLDLVADREARLADRVFPDFPDLAEAHAWAAEVRELFLRDAPAAAPCHNDPNLANVIDSPHGLVLVDWQNSGMADPDWECGGLLARLRDAGRRDAFLAALHGDPGHPRAARVRLAEVLARWGEVVEGLVMHLKEPDEPGWTAHAQRALEVVRARRDNDGFARAMAALRRGGAA